MNLEIKLTKNQTAIIDFIDKDLMQFKWQASKNIKDRTYRAQRGIRNGNKIITVYLSKIILERKLGRKLEFSEEVDHIDRNQLNNKRNNLRLATRKQNSVNRGLFSNNTSGLVGVSFKHKKYEASLETEGKYIYLGRFEIKEEAGQMRDRAALYIFGNFAFLNFPELKEQYLNDLKTNTYKWAD